MKDSEQKILQYEPSPEVKAFIFQQIQDLEPFLEKVGGLGVFVEKTEKHQEGGQVEENFLIRLVVSPDGGRIEVQGESPNIFEACIKAKSSLVSRLSPLVNALSATAGRDELVEYFSQGGQVH
ncbi:MAG: hypothetical protein H6624_11530 [Bdellovibrionaceae bacterium]|nr:hypothetical protein [Bdellovibrionales bacterium]MCB9084970.1 hypothetical protein [Pseudobdellovibrionaceae bacterium]